MDIFAAHTRFESHLLLLLQRVRTLSSPSSPGFIHYIVAVVAVIVITINYVYDNIRIIHVQLVSRTYNTYMRIIYMTRVYAVCVYDPLFPRYNGDMSWRWRIFIKYQTKLSSKSIIWHSTSAYHLYTLYIYTLWVYEEVYSMTYIYQEMEIHNSYIAYYILCSCSIVHHKQRLLGRYINYRL